MLGSTGDCSISKLKYFLESDEQAPDLFGYPTKSLSRFHWTDPGTQFPAGPLRQLTGYRTTAEEFPVAREIME